MAKNEEEPTSITELKTEKSWGKTPFYFKLKYFVEIIGILGGCFLIFFNLYQLKLLKGELVLNTKQLLVNEEQLKLNENQLKLLNESLNIERSKSEAQLEVWQRGRKLYVSLGGNTTNQDFRTQITLLFRNRSPRSTAIIDIYVRRGEEILGGSRYEDQIKLPIQIGPWEVKRVDFRLEQDDEKRYTNIFIRDMEDRTISIPVSPGKEWIKVRQKG